MWFSPINYRLKSIDIDREHFSRLRHKFDYDLGMLCTKEGLWKMS